MADRRAAPNGPEDLAPEAKPASPAPVAGLGRGVPAQGRSGPRRHLLPPKRQANRDLLRRPPARSPSGRPCVVSRRVLLILDDCGAGDAARLGFCVKAVRQSLPDAHLTLVVSEE